jgi:hypothetical protein
MVLAIWIITALLIALWSLLSWGAHGILTLGAGWAGDLEPLVDQVPHGNVIEAWIPGWQELLKLALDLTPTVLGWAGGAVPVIVWVAWSLGVAALVITAGVLTLVVSLLRKSMPQRPPATA